MYPAGDWLESTTGELQAAMANRELTALELVRYYTGRVQALDWAGPCLSSVIELNPEAEEIARKLDHERQRAGLRGPLHGIPILLKDNIDTADRMQTSAGSLALAGSKPRQDAFVARKLRDAGAILLGKSNLTEWSSIRSFKKSSGWSGRGGQCRNPYILTHSPFGSSSGSAVAVSANLAAAALGTETDGSIVNPAHINGVVGIKPTVGLTSRAGVIPISHSQDTVGPLARTVRDAAILLGAITGFDRADPATGASAGKSCMDYTRFLDAGGLKGARIGIARQVYFGYNRHADTVIETAISAMREQGAVIIDPADIPTAQEIKDSPDGMTVLTYEFKHDLEAYLATRRPDPAHPGSNFLRSLAEIIAFNEAHFSQEMLYFGQEIFETAAARGPLTEAAYLSALANNRRRAGRNGIDAVMSKHRLDALVAPTGQPAWPTDLLNGDHTTGVSSTPAGLVGYPIVTVPAGFVSGLPVGVSFMGQAYSEPTLIKLAYAFEQATKARKAPQFLATFPLPGRA
jgi:amidase